MKGLELLIAEGREGFGRSWVFERMSKVLCRGHCVFGGGKVRDLDGVGEEVDGVAYAG